MVHGSKIDTFGNKLDTLDLGLSKVFAYPFYIVNMEKPILGADFLNKFGIWVDVQNGRLIDSLCMTDNARGIVTNFVQIISTFSSDGILVICL